MPKSPANRFAQFKFHLVAPITKKGFLVLPDGASLAASNPHALRRFVERAYRQVGVVFDASRMLLVIQPVYRSVIEQIGDVKYGVATIAKKKIQAVAQ